MQRLISLTNIFLVSISFFGNTGKFMVQQPGNMDGNNIVKGLTDFVLIKPIIADHS